MVVTVFGVRRITPLTTIGLGAWRYSLFLPSWITVSTAILFHVRFYLESLIRLLIGSWTLQNQLRNKFSHVDEVWPCDWSTAILIRCL